MTAALARRPAAPGGLDLEAFARAAGLHPELVRRFVALGLLDAARAAAGDLSFSPTQLAAATRIHRLRTGLGLNYAAVGVVVELLDRIALLEAALRTRPRTRGGPPWTPTA
jgi:hypothetical protein